MAYPNPAGGYEKDNENVSFASILKQYQS